MKILIISDHESKFIWDHFKAERYEDIDLVIACGDLKASYLSFLVTMLRAPVYYVNGNHDDRYVNDPPLGCDCLDDRFVVFKGIRIVGLGGSYRYKPGPFQYTEQEMYRRYQKLKGKIRRHKGFDILVTHAPALGFGDGEDLCHRGFATFTEILDTYQPSYYLHGHVHLNYNRHLKRITEINGTTIINAYDHYIFEYEPNNLVYKQKKKLLSFFK